jgi:dihydrofolate reductase
MRKLVLWMQLSLDGYTEGPNGEFDWPVVKESLHSHFVERAREHGAFLYGRKVYEGMTAYWPTADADPNATKPTVEYAQLWRPIPKVVFSKTLEKADWNTEIVREDIAGAVAKLKEQPGGDIVLFGGAEIARQFIAQDLVDEYTLFVHPVILGGGKALFPAGERKNVKLVESKSYDGGVVHLQYARA